MIRTVSRHASQAVASFHQTNGAIAGFCLTRAIASIALTTIHNAAQPAQDREFVIKMQRSGAKIQHGQATITAVHA
jgi:hypothetical protein